LTARLPLLDKEGLEETLLDKEHRAESPLSSPSGSVDAWSSAEYPISWFRSFRAGLLFRFYLLLGFRSGYDGLATVMSVDLLIGFPLTTGLVIIFLPWTALFTAFSQPPSARVGLFS